MAHPVSRIAKRIPPEPMTLLTKTLTPVRLAIQRPGLGVAKCKARGSRSRGHFQQDQAVFVSTRRPWHGDVFGREPELLRGPDFPSAASVGRGGSGVSWGPRE